jgi:dolichol-phosphate mannosyltransferase
MTELMIAARAEEPIEIASARGVPLLSVVIPTFNEADNVARMRETALTGIPFEIVFVDDDSRDGTLERLAALAAADPRVRVVHRIGRRGLSTAVCEGILSTTSPFVAVIDADMQHDERILPQMLNILRRGEADLVVGSRYTEGGGVGDWDASRVRVSALAK